MKRLALIAGGSALLVVACLMARWGPQKVVDIAPPCRGKSASIRIEPAPPDSPDLVSRKSAGTVAPGQPARHPGRYPVSSPPSLVPPSGPRLAAMRKTATAHSVRHAGRTRSGGSFDVKPPAVPLVYQISGETFQTELPHVPLEVIDSIREAFEKQAGVGELAPDDPEYARRWRLAEPSALERMRTLFGWSVVAEFQRQAALEAIRSTPPPFQHDEHHEGEE